MSAGPRLGRWLRAEAGEVRAAAWSAAQFACLLASYFALRPIRDEMGVQAGIERLPELVTWTLAGMLVLNPAFGALASRWPRRTFLPWALRAFGLMLVGWAAWAWLGAPDGNVGFAKAYFVWLSVFNMFVVSLFWGFMADTWRPEQATRLYGPIGVGGTVGALVGGAAVPALRALEGALGGQGEHLGALLPMVFLLAAVLLEATVACQRRVAAASEDGAGSPAAPAGPRRDDAALGGRMLDGARALVRQPYLLGAAGVVLAYSLVSTVLYVVRLRTVAASSLAAGDRAALFGWSEVAAQAATLLTQLFLTARLLPRLGVGWTLALGPLVTLAAFLVLAPDPTLPLAVGAVALTRAVHFALAKPAQEALFSVVARDEKYKAKSLLDTVGARLGDWVGTEATGWVRALEPALYAVPVAGIPLAVLWLALSLGMGRARARRVGARAGGQSVAG